MLVKHIKEVTEFLAGDHTILKEVLHPSNDPIDINYSIAHARLEVGTASLPHRLKGSETYYILEGEGEIIIEGTTQHIKKGSIAFVPPSAKQFVRNIGQVDLVFLCIVEPYWRPEDEEV
ncbi:MAG: cupin domain-containing protein [Aureispira sp.]|nr:cupin domain-containing protein [Aureispira sp.]